jgi:retinol-binding protein 3
MRRVVSAIIAALLFCLLASAQNAPAPSAPKGLTEPARAAVVAKLADILMEKYVFPDIGRTMADLIRGNLRAGLYAPLERPEDLAQKLTEDILSVSHDKHLGVVYNPDWGWLSWSKEVNEEEQKRLEKRWSRMENYGFREVRILPGNIGYLKLDYFSGNPDAFPVAVGALAFLAGTDALVFDLRENGGGESQMIQVITSYLFEGEPKHLNSFYYRQEDRTEQSWTLPYVPGKRMPDVPVFVLTSERTFSGAEEFSYDLKNLKRATIVGEITGGGAHPVNRERIEGEFWVSVPFARAVNPVSKTNWEGTGVEPDVKVPAPEALDTALALALEKLSTEENEPRFKDFYLWHLDAQKAKAAPVALPEAELKAIPGTYGLRRITLEGGSLYYQREGRPKFRMIPLTADTFAFEEAPEFRVRFLREGDRVTALEARSQDGHKETSPRTE